MDRFSQEGKQIFRKVALDRLSSPERLDDLAPITSPKGWLILITFLVLIVAVIVWGFYGTIPTRVMGRGILLTSGSVVNVVSQSTGRISNITIKSNKKIEKGEIIATITQPELVKEVASLREKLEELETKNRQTKIMTSKDLNVKRGNIRKEQENLKTQIGVLNERKEWYKEKIEGQEQLLAQGLITRQTFLSSREGLQAIEGKLKDAEIEIKKLSVRQLEIENTAEKENTESLIAANDVRRNISILEKRLAINSTVVAPLTGRVIEVMASEGDLVQPSRPIVSIEPWDDQKHQLEVIIYVPLADGQKIKPDMTVQVTPVSVKRAEFGFMLANVRSVARFPATLNGMMNVLANEQLVNALTKEGALVAVTADLIADNKAPSGYRWSSGRGPSIQVTSGTFCDVSIIVNKQSPITLAIPLFKKTLGIE